jgi:hypothetical protein
MKFFCIILNLLVISFLVNGQELRNIVRSDKNVTEKYFVLKKNKKIKQGQYIKLREVAFPGKTFIEEFGKYENNKRTGVWLSFAANHPEDPLVSTGEYSYGNKEGVWRYFYSSVIKDSGSTYLKSYKPLTELIEPENATGEYKIVIDTAGIGEASVGRYSSDKKTGIWEYYLRDGSLFYKYDHSSDSMIWSLSDDREIIRDLLGGVTRFREILGQAMDDYLHKSRIYKPSTVTIDVITGNDKVVCRLVQSTGEKAFAEMIEKAVLAMPVDWINYDPNLERNVMQIQMSYKVEDNRGKVHINSIIPKSYSNEYK